MDNNGEVVSAQDYFAYGEIIPDRSYNTGDANARFKFTEKERDTESGYDYFGARYYDSERGQWTTIDPLWEKYHGWSPYNYTLNNPINNFDPDGRYVQRTNKQGQTYFQQWTVNGAFNQLRKENLLHPSTVDLKRSSRNDPSFNVKSWEGAYSLPYTIAMTVDALTNGIGILPEVLGLDKVRQFLTSDEFNNLSRDEAIFSAVMNQTIDGIKLAKYNAESGILELSDAMRIKKEIEGMSSTDIDDYWIGEFQRIEGDVVKNFVEPIQDGSRVYNK